MKFAVVDIGNTAIKCGLFEKDRLAEALRFPEITAAITYLQKHKPAKTLICSVIWTETQISEALTSLSDYTILNRLTPLPIINGYNTPETLGYDRLAAATGAWFRFPDENSLIIDMGTAIKYDFINSLRVFQGGIIGPGMRMRFNALHTFTKKLPLIQENGIPPLIGNTTESCIQSGVINGMAAEINGIIERYRQIGEINTLICGGDAPFFESQINYPTFAAQNLVLEGLYRILKHNV